MSALYSRATALIQLGQTLRYHTEVCLKPQDVAQHSFNVAWFCWLLSDGEPSAALLMAALAHDAAERWTGDLPAPTKRRLHLSDLFNAEEVKLLRVQLGFTQLERLSRVELDILKLADILDGCFYCLRELRLGNTIVLDDERGGAAFNFLRYLSDRIQTVEAPFVRKTALELEIQLRSEFKRYAPEYLGTPI